MVSWVGVGDLTAWIVSVGWAVAGGVGEAVLEVGRIVGGGDVVDAVQAGKNSSIDPRSRINGFGQ